MKDNWGGKLSGEEIENYHCKLSNFRGLVHVLQKEVPWKPEQLLKVHLAAGPGTRVWFIVLHKGYYKRVRSKVSQTSTCAGVQYRQT